MDPLTHTLVGASLASSRLGRVTGLAAPALVIGANLPDVDVLSYVNGSDAALGFRRGWTHGVPALIVLPLLLAAVLWLWSRLRPSAARPAVAPGRLTALCYLAVWTHPALDWLNTYGMRWWMPLDDTWYHGDTLFIMDPWLWLMLGIGWLLPRRPTVALSITFAMIAGLLILVVAGRASGYLPLVATAAGLLLAAFVVKIPPAAAATRLLPTAGLLLGGVYVAGMLWVHGVTESRVREELTRAGHEPDAPLMVGPTPADPLRWDVVFEADRHYRFGSWDWRRDAPLQLADERLIAARGTELWDRIASGGSIPGFRRWARFPWLGGLDPPADGRVYVMDARYARERTTGFGGAAVELPATE